METLLNHKEIKYELPSCFFPEVDNPYPLCVGRGLKECEDCQLCADWEPDDPYGIGV